MTSDRSLRETPITVHPPDAAVLHRGAADSVGMHAVAEARTKWPPKGVAAGNPEPAQIQRDIIGRDPDEVYVVLPSGQEADTQI